MTYKVKKLSLAICAAFLALAVAFSAGLLAKPAYAEEADCPQTGIHIEGFDSTTESGIWDVHYDNAHTVTTNADYVKQGDGAFYTRGNGISDGSWALANTVDISEADCVTFWLYLENAASFNNMEDGQLVLSNVSAVDEAKIYWSLKGRDFQDGWQRVTFGMDEAGKEVHDGYTLDLTQIAYCRIYFVSIDEVCTAVFDDLHANYTQGIQLEGFNTGSVATTHITTDPNQIKEGNGAYIEKGGGFNNNAFNLEKVVDVSKFDAIAFWLYLENADGFNNMSGDNKLQLSDLVLEDGDMTVDSAKIFWTLSGRGFTDGWNYVVLTFASASSEGSAVDMTKISSMRLYCNSMDMSNGIVLSVFDDIRAIETQFLPDEAEPIESYTITDGESIVGGVFDGMTQAYSDHKQGVSCLVGSVSAQSNTLTALFGPLESGLSKSAGDNELGLSFWLYIEDTAKAGSVSVALSSAASAGGFELVWTLSDLQNGWNWIALKASDASETNVADMNGLQRLSIAFGASDTVAVKLDRVRIYNTASVGDWNTQPEGEARVLAPVDEVRVSDLDAVTSSVFNGASVETQNHKQGVGAAVLGGTGAYTISGIDLGTTDLLAADPTSVNEFGITLWLYADENAAYDSFTIAMGSSAFGAAGYENAGRILFEVAASDLSDGWNWLVLKATEATAVSTDFNPDAIQWFLIRGNGENASSSYMADRISVVNATVASATAQPSESEKETRNPVSGKIIIDCDSTDDITFGGNSVDLNDKREGKGSVRTEGAGFQLTAKYLEVGKTDLTKDTLVLCMWVYIEDPEAYGSSYEGQIELSSSNTNDVEEITWVIGKNGHVDFSALPAGWNWIVLFGSEADYTGGTPDFDAFDYFRLYVNGCSYTAFKLDRVTLTNIYDEASFAEPDWESELFGGGGDENFKGSNSKYADDTYLETEITGDAFDTVVVTEQEGGCGSVINHSATAATALAVCGAALLLVWKGRKTRKRD